MTVVLVVIADSVVGISVEVVNPNNVVAVEPNIVVAIDSAVEE